MNNENNLEQQAFVPQPPLLDKSNTPINKIIMVVAVIVIVSLVAIVAYILIKNNQTGEKKKTDLLTAIPIQENTPSPENLIILSPTGNENLCIGQDYPIQWKAPKDLEVVEIFLRGDTTIGAPKLADKRAFTTKGSDIGQYTWTVGNDISGKYDIKEGEVYSIQIAGNSPTKSYSTTTKIFSIKKCAGVQTTSGSNLVKTLEPLKIIFSSTAKYIISKLPDVTFKIVKITKATGDVVKQTGCSGTASPVFLESLYIGSSGICINTKIIDGQEMAMVAADIDVINNGANNVTGDLIQLFYTIKIDGKDVTRLAQTYLPFRSYSVAPMSSRTIRVGYLVPANQNVFRIIFGYVGSDYRSGESFLGAGEGGFEVDFSKQTLTEING
jgi:hypothetical protein